MERLVETTSIGDELYLGEWSSWYAWYPVMIEDKLVWLSHIERRHYRIRMFPFIHAMCHFSGWHHREIASG
jgi:hypothetical protein